MKKRILLIVSILFSFACLYANDQKIWSVDSEVFKYLNYLYISQGHAMPNSTGPWSTDELKRMLHNLPAQYEDEKTQFLYDKIDEILEAPSKFSTEDNFNYSVGVATTPELYFHTNKEDFTEEDDWYYDFEKRNDILDITAEIYGSSWLYAFLDLNLGYSSNIEDDTLYSQNVVSNVPFVTGMDMGYISSNFPTTSFLSAGGEHWNFSAGRNILRWGNGETGNLFLGGNQIYDNNLRFSLFYNKFKFSFASIFYPHPETKNQHGTDTSVDGVRLFLGHRIDFRFFKDRMNLSFSESIMYQNASATLDLRVFNPMMIYHSLFIRGNANSMMGIDFDYTILPGFNIYSQMVLDEFAFSGEPTSSSEFGWRPTKLGGLVGTKLVFPTNLGMLKMSLEGVYTDPCLYLRESYRNGIYGVSFYGDLREYQNKYIMGGGNAISYLSKCIGYIYGGDAVVCDLKFSLDSLNKWTSGLEFFYMAHGIMYNELDADWIYGPKNKSPSSEDQTGSSNESGVPEHFFRVSLSGDYDIFDWLSVDCGIDNWLIWNKNNQPKSMVYDFQLHSGIKIQK